MAQPLPHNQPLVDVLRQNKITIAEMNQMLKDGADEAERLIPKLIEKHTTGGRVRAAQLALVQRELKVAQSALWGDLGASLRQGVGAAVEQAASTAAGTLLGYLGQYGVSLPGWRESLAATARQGIAAVLAKAKNGIPLARSVYHTQALASGQVDRKVAQGLLLGHDAKRIAKSVKDLIRPDVAGGVAYAAHRLARTEINHAYKTSQETRYAEDPWVTGMRWNLSGSHPKPDICNVLADRDDHGLGQGIYPVGQRPDSHPNCLCYLTAEQVDEDDFVDAFLNGDYNTHIDRQMYGSAPTEHLPCP